MTVTHVAVAVHVAMGLFVLVADVARHVGETSSLAAQLAVVGWLGVVAAGLALRPGSGARR